MGNGREDPCDVDAVRRMFGGPLGPELWERLAAENWTDDVVYREDPMWPGAQTFSGREAVVARFREYRDLMGDPATELVELAAGERAVLAIFDFTAAGGSSGAPFRQRWAWVIRTQDGRMREIHAHLDLDEARRKAGVG